MRHKNGKPAKAKRAGKKSASASSRASRKAAPRSGKAPESSATEPADSTASAAPSKRKRRRGRQAAAGTTPAAVGKRTDSPKLGSDFGPNPGPPPLSTEPAAAASRSTTEQEPIGPALPDSAIPPSSAISPNSAIAIGGERRRGAERSRSTTSYSDGKRTKSDSRRDSSDSSDPPPRTNKLVPTNAVHPTERRIKRRMHKNGALMAAAGAALLGVLILSNQSEPPELVLSDRQMASRLPSGRDWQSDAASDTEYQATHRAVTPDSDSPRVTAPSPSEGQETTDQIPQLASRVRPTTNANGLSTGDIAEMERMLDRLDLDAGTPDGVIDDDTKQAIRLYQEFAGLHVDGEASRHLLADMREVVKILDGDN